MKETEEGAWSHLLGLQRARLKAQMKEHGRVIQRAAQGQLEGTGEGLAFRPAQLTAAVQLHASHQPPVCSWAPSPDPETTEQ